MELITTSLHRAPLWELSVFEFAGVRFRWLRPVPGLRLLLRSTRAVQGRRWRQQFFASGCHYTQDVFQGFRFALWRRFNRSLAFRLGRLHRAASHQNRSSAPPPWRPAPPASVRKLVSSLGSSTASAPRLASASARRRSRHGRVVRDRAPAPASISRNSASGRQLVQALQVEVVEKHLWWVANIAGPPGHVAVADHTDPLALHQRPDDVDCSPPRPARLRSRHG